MKNNGASTKFAKATGPLARTGEGLTAARAPVVVPDERDLGHGGRGDSASNDGASFR